MTLPSKRSLLAMAVCGALLAPALARASDSSTADIKNASLSLDPVMATGSEQKSQTAVAAGSDPAESPVLTLHPTGFASKLHGFADFRIVSQYITPRGLVAEEDSPQFQTVGGLVFNLFSGDGMITDVSVFAGAWMDLNSHPDKSKVTGADIMCEVDYFGGIEVKFAKYFDATYTIQAWTFPDLTEGSVEIDPTTEYNMDLKLAFDDSEWLKDFALHPYIDIFWNFAGKSSPVVADALLGKNDHTFYVELGIAPSYTYKGISDLPITFTLPTYFSMGDSSFWGETPSGDRSNFGVVSTGLKISAPIKFVPADYGNWSAYVGVTYIHTCNPALTYINSGTGADSNLVVGYAGVGFNF